MQEHIAVKIRPLKPNTNLMWCFIEPSGMFVRIFPRNTRIGTQMHNMLFDDTAPVILDTMAVVKHWANLTPN
jgi:hypothetical protein